MDRDDLAAIAFWAVRGAAIAFGLVFLAGAAGVAVQVFKLAAGG